MPNQDRDLSAYFGHLRALRSDDPAIGRPAVSGLLELARKAAGPIQAHAERILTAEFGPYFVSDGMSGCIGPIDAVHACDAEGRACRYCPWLWPEESGQGNGDVQKVEDD